MLDDYITMYDFLSGSVSGFLKFLDFIKKISKK